MVPVPATKGFWAGTHRLVPPEETLARVRPLLRRAGITRVANVTGLDCIGLPVVMVCRPNARALSVSQGKGLTLPAAEASGIMESLEAYHAETITAPLKLASYAELQSQQRVVDVLELPRCGTSLFHPDRRLLWIEGQDLVANESAWLPYEVVHGDFTLPFPSGSGCFPMTSNGLASGNHRLEAISHGICEVVERDAERLWELGGTVVQERSRIDVASVDDTECRAVLERFDRAGIACAIWDTSSDVGVAAFYCLIGAREENPFHPRGTAAGMGCHPNRAVALLRALTEAAQSRLTEIAGSRDDIDPRNYTMVEDAVLLARNRALLDGHGERSFTDVPSHTVDTFDGDLAWEIERLRSAGIEHVIVVDLSRPDFGVPVVRVVIPGMEGPAVVPDLVPGRRAWVRLAR
jgi:ribosomal protein S12 methylthiotransferase accessory factor